MDNKETLNEHNTRINLNNDELASILITINKLPTVKEWKLQDKVVEPSTTEQTITADEEYSGLASVTVNAVTNEIDSNIVAENIKDGVEILGVTGTLQEGITPSGEIAINDNGVYDVTNYASANVNIESTGADFEINDCSNLFYQSARTDVMDRLLALCKNVTSTSYMFYDCRNLTSLDLSNFNTSQVVNMRNMFYGCNALTNLDISNFDTSNVTNMNNMFDGCKGFSSIDVSSFNTSKVTTIASMFNACSKLTDIDLSNFDTSKVTNMSYLFNSCIVLPSLDLSNFYTSNVTNMSGIVAYCNQLTLLDIRNFTFDKVTSYNNMFTNSMKKDCLIIVKGDTEKEWITSKFTFLTNVKTVAEYESS